MVGGESGGAEVGVVGCRWVSVEGRRRRVVGGESVCVEGGVGEDGGGERHHPYTHTHGAATILGFRVRRRRAEDGRRSTEVSRSVEGREVPEVGEVRAFLWREKR